MALFLSSLLVNSAGSHDLARLSIEGSQNPHMPTPPVSNGSFLFKVGARIIPDACQTLDAARALTEREFVLKGTRALPAARAAAALEFCFELNILSVVLIRRDEVLLILSGGSSAPSPPLSEGLWTSLSEWLLSSADPLEQRA